MKNKLILILAIAFAMVAALGTYKYLENVKETYRKSGNFARVALAAARIPAKTPITEQMLQFIEMPAEYILPGSVIDAKDALGKLARSDIYPGEQILQSKLIGKDDPAGGLSSKIEPGLRAVTVAVDQVSAVAGLVSPGDRVDVAVTTGSDSGAVTSTILFKILILAVNQNTTPRNGDKSSPGTATLMVDPTQAQQLILASETGSIRLLLRSPQDDKSVGLPSSRQKELIR